MAYQRSAQSKKPAPAPRKLTPKEEARAAKRAARERFLRVRKAGGRYERQLRAVAKQIGIIVNGMAPDGEVQNLPLLEDALGRYSDAIKPWAVAVTARMHGDIAVKDERAWAQHGRSIGRALRKEIAEAPTGKLFRELLEPQAALITSLPLEAAKRVHDITIKARSQGNRAKELAREVMKQGDVSKSRAMLIARTEIARTAATLGQARAEYVGSTHYVWRSVEDSDVREEHRELNGKTFAWAEPPIAGEKGERSHPGCIYNCRCWAEPILPDMIT